ncbi:LysE family translocator [Salinisphaera aquimarina]|uniref:LysE family translocator n=1 Tax=Salinisphaera aquimarina TaxID=2094031 RepID=A0ABV7EU26_9GAMM
MTTESALISFAFAATLMTITPGIDTALVLRTAVVENTRHALWAGCGVVTGVLAWGLLTALGLGAVLAVSETAYRVLQFAGAAYLVWLGACMLWAAARTRTANTAQEMGDHDSAQSESRGRGARRWFVRGLLTNLLNPKVGVFYVSFLPQFIPTGVNVVAFSMVLAALHAGLSLLWFVGLALAARPFERVLARPSTARALDGITGTVLVGFGLRLALDSR